MTSLFGLQIQRSVSRSNSVIRTASGCSSISGTHNGTLLFRNRPHEHRISRSQHRFTSGIRSVSHPTDLATFSVPRKAPLSPRFASRAYTKDEEEYEEREDVEEEWADAVAEQKAPEPKRVEVEKYEEEFEETEPKYAASIMPYFRKNKPDQFKENEEIVTDDLNKQAQSKYTKAVEGRDTFRGDTIRYRLEVARSRVNEEDDEPRAYNVADVYREQYIKRERNFFAHLQPSNMRPFGSNDSLFFPMRSNKVQYPTYKPATEISELNEDAATSSKRSGSSRQQREYSTVSNKKRNEPESRKTVNSAQTRDFSNAVPKRRHESAKSRRNETAQNPLLDKNHVSNRKLSVLPSKTTPDSAKETRKEKHKYPEKEVRFKVTTSHELAAKPTLKSIQARKQSSQLQTEENTKKPINIMPIHMEGKSEKRALQPGSVEEKQVIDRALTFAQKYREIYLADEAKSARKIEPKSPPKTVQDDVRVNLLTSPKPKTPLRATSRLNVLQSSATPEEVALLDEKPRRNERFIAPWPAYSETVRKTQSPVSHIRFPTDTSTKPIVQKKLTSTIAESAQAREYSTVYTRRSAKKVKRLGTRKSFLPKILHKMFCSIMPRRPYSEKKSQECEEEDLLPLDRPDCPKPKEEPLKDCEPLARLKPRQVASKPKCVKVKKESCPPRADAGLKVKPKKLRTITPGKCNPEKVKMKDCSPLKRLKKVHIPEPPKCEVSAQQMCGDRADDNLVVKKKALPIMEPEDCPKPEPYRLKDIKLPRLKKVKVPVPPRVCPKETTECPVRADASLKIEKKELPELEAMDCPKVPPHPLKESPPLQRLAKVDIPEPPKVCQKEDDYCSSRADEGLKVQAKSLPYLEPLECPEPEEPPMKDCDPLQRLPKMEPYDPPKCKIVKEIECPPRADDGLKVEPKCLPEIVPDEGCKPETSPLKDCQPLSRLPKKQVPEPPRCVIKKAGICPERADKNWVLGKKQLPKLEAQACPVPEPEPMKDVTLRRLEKVFMPEPPRICPKITTCDTPRADSCLKVEKKELPPLEPIDCPKVPPHPMKDMKPLPRLAKILIKEPPKICPVEEVCPERADKNWILGKKQLPKLEAQACPVPEPEPMKDVTLRRLEKVFVPEPPRICPKITTCDTPRADSCLKVEKKELPPLEPIDCPKVPPHPMKDLKPLPRLAKILIKEPPKICPVEEVCPERADKNWVLGKKQLPKLEAQACPVPEPEPMKDVTLHRLEKVFMPEPPRICPKVTTCDTPRADSCLKVEKKELPPLEPIDCPKVPPHPMKDLKPLPRLAKILIKEPPKICPVEEACPERADEGLKIQSKALPVLKAPECVELPSPPMKEGCPLVRLPKMEPYEPPKCKKVIKFECPKRADAGFTIESKRLPELKPHEGCKPKPSRMKDCEPLKRPKRAPVPEPERCKRIKDEKCTMKRADEGLKVKTKQLPVLKAPDCPQIPSEPMKDIKLPRLKKVKMKPPPRVCPKAEVECPKRADDGLKIEKKTLPELETPDCPQVPSEPMKDVKLARLKKVKLKEPPKICPEEETCPDRADAVVGYKIKKKPLKTVILSKKYNEISFRQFRKTKKKNKGPCLKTKRKYHRIASGYVMSKPSSNRIYYTLPTRSTRKVRRKFVPYRSRSECYQPKQKEECPPRPPLCPPKKEPPKSIWQKICDYFKARPGCPAPDEWKKKILREKAEKAAKAAGLYLCECPCVGRKQFRAKKKTCSTKRKKKPQCPKFKMPYCNEQEVTFCENKVTPIECDPPRETPYPSFSEWQREMRTRKMSECKVADKKSKEMKGQIKAMKKKRRQESRCFSTRCSDFTLRYHLQKRRAAKIIQELNKELKEQMGDDVQILMSCDVPRCKQSVT